MKSSTPTLWRREPTSRAGLEGLLLGHPSRFCQLPHEIMLHGPYLFVAALPFLVPECAGAETCEACLSSTAVRRCPAKPQVGTEGVGQPAPIESAQLPARTVLQIRRPPRFMRLREARHPPCRASRTRQRPGALRSINDGNRPTIGDIKKKNLS